jgi:mycothiol synthase
MTGTMASQRSLPAGFTLRAPELADAEEVAALVNAATIADGGDPISNRAAILAQWEDPLRTLEDEDWLIVAPDGRIAGFLELYEYEPFTLFEFDGYVHPEFRGHGVGTALLDIIEPRARREMHRAPAGEPVFLRSRAWSTADAAHRLLIAHGYEHVRDWRRMRIELTAPPPTPIWSPGINVRRFVPGQDERAVWETSEAAFADHFGTAPMPFDEFIYYRIESLTEFDPSLWFLAMDGDAVAGILLAHAGDSRLPEGAWVALLGVRREYRGRGIGLALLHEAFGEFYRRGYRVAGLDVDGSSLTGADRLYERAGMFEVHRAYYFDKPLIGKETDHAGSHS